MTLTIVQVVVAIVVCAALVCASFVAGSTYRRKTAEAKIGSAEEEAMRIVNEAIKTAEQKRKEAIVEAKDEAFRLKSEADKEILILRFEKQMEYDELAEKLGITDFAARQRVSRAVRRMRKLMARDEEEEPEGAK